MGEMDGLEPQVRGVRVPKHRNMHRYTSTRSTPYKGTAIADITLKLTTELTYRWEHFRVGFPIFANICIKKKTTFKCRILCQFFLNQIFNLAIK